MEGDATAVNNILLDYATAAQSFRTYGRFADFQPTDMPARAKALSEEELIEITFRSNVTQTIFAYPSMAGPSE